MTARSRTHFRILNFPGDEWVGGGYLESIQLNQAGIQQDILLDYQALQCTAPAQVFERGGHLWEQVKGQYAPRRLRFVKARFIEGREIGSSLLGLPSRHPDRLIYLALAWGTPEGQNFYKLNLLRQEEDVFFVEAEKCIQKDRVGEACPVEFERDWSPPPLSPARLIPMPRRLWQRFGGDPVAVHLHGRCRPMRLFVGGMENQTRERPQVGSVLNLSGGPSLWSVDQPAWPADRWVHYGEGSHGMKPADFIQEAGWVIERLQRGERVLVHCSAGMNRSSSVCCAVLILLEGLSAEAALARVREGHPWARPDPRHWLALRWLAQRQRGGEKE